MNLFSDTEFFNSGVPKKIAYALPDADLVYIENFFLKEEADELYTKLLNDTKWLETKKQPFMEKSMIRQGLLPGMAMPVRTILFPVTK